MVVLWQTDAIKNGLGPLPAKLLAKNHKNVSVVIDSLAHEYRNPSKAYVLKTSMRIQTLCSQQAVCSPLTHLGKCLQILVV